MSDKTLIAEDSMLAPLQILDETDVCFWTIDVPGVVSSLTTPTMKFYKQNTGTDQSATYFTGSITIPTGSYSIVTKTTNGALKAGDWVVTVKAIVDGNTITVMKIPVTVKRENQL